MENVTIQYDFLLAMILGVFLGLIPAAIAKSKGQSFIAWWAFGAALFIVALPMSILAKPITDPPNAGFCEVCNSNVWLYESGGCENGHPKNVIKGAYRADKSELLKRDAGFCEVCNKNVWLNEEGECEKGHSVDSIKGIYKALSIDGDSQVQSRP